MVYNKVHFHWKIFYVLSTMYSNTLSISTQHFSPTACWIRQALLYMYVHHSAQQKLLYVHVYSNKLKQDLNSSCKHYFNDYHYSISFLLAEEYGRL